MKKLVSMVVFLLLIAASASAQVEQGDREIQAVGAMYATAEMTVITILGTYGYYYRPNVEFGVGPTIAYVEVFGYDQTMIGGTFYGRYYFSTNTKVVPYLAGQWYQFDFSPPEPLSFTDLSFLQAGAGLKYFISEHLAWDVSLNLGVGLGSSDTSMLLLGGLSAFF